MANSNISPKKTQFCEVSAGKGLYFQLSKYDLLMRIYHYTSIENLVLILKNKTIRFNRLDKMDDHCECHFFSFKLNWSPYTYVSCWTESAEESIPLWNMYAKGGAGIRIGVDKDCIDWKLIPASGLISICGQEKTPPPTRANQSIASIRYTPFTIYGDIGTRECYHHIKYLTDSYQNNNAIIGCNQTLIPKRLMEEDFRDHVGLYKDKKWAFQNEVRFRIFGVPKVAEEGSMQFEEFEGIIENNTFNPITYIDLPIKESAFNNFEITLGPDATESSFVLVKLLIKEYIKNRNIRDILRGSSLNSETWHFLSDINRPS